MTIRFAIYSHQKQRELNEAKVQIINDGLNGQNRDFIIQPCYMVSGAMRDD